MCEEDFLFICINWSLLDRYDINYCSVVFVIFIVCFNRFNRLLWLIVLNVVLRFSRISIEMSLLLEVIRRLFVIFIKVVFVL